MGTTQVIDAAHVRRPQHTSLSCIYTCIPSPVVCVSQSLALSIPLPQPIKDKLPYPVAVAFAAHYQLAVRHAPQFPGAVVADGGQDGLAWMEGQATHGVIVATESLFGEKVREKFMDKEEKYYERMRVHSSFAFHKSMPQLSKSVRARECPLLIPFTPSFLFHPSTLY